MSTDNVYRTRSLGVANEGIPDQYADGKAARVWALYIGDKKERTKNYREFLTTLLRKHRLNSVLDVACGTGIDSIMLLEEGFKVMSVDASDKMLKYALKERWNRRRESAFDGWIIEEANWLTLSEDIVKPSALAGEVGFDALLCLGNSFAHLPDSFGDQSEHRLAIDNFFQMLKPGGYLIIDHRNYDNIVNTGRTGEKNIYYTSKYIKDIITSVLYVNNKPSMITLDYKMNIAELGNKVDQSTDSVHTKRGRYSGEVEDHFRLSYYPHLLDQFTKLLKCVFGHEAHHQVFGDFKPFESWDEQEPPAFYIHFIQRPL